MEEKISIEKIGRKRRTKEEIDADLREADKVSETKIEELGLADLDGIGPITVTKMKNVGIHKISDLLVRTPSQLIELTGKTPDSIEKIMRTAYEFLQKSGALEKTSMSARESYEIDKTRHKLVTGCNSLNKFFNGGIEPGKVTEIYGPFGCGKTQFCFQLSVYAQLPIDAGGLDGNVIYLDTEDVFSSQRILDIVVNRELVPVQEYKKSDIEKGISKVAINPDEALKFLDGIKVIKPFNSMYQTYTIDNLNDELDKVWENGKKVKLVIIDSLLGHFRLDFQGRANLSDRQIAIANLIGKIDKLKVLHNDIAFVVTNQVLENASGMGFGDPTRPIGGNVVAHTMTYRVYFMKAGAKRIAKFIDSPSHAYQETPFTLGLSGVIDIEDKK